MSNTDRHNALLSGPALEAAARTLWDTLDPPTRWDDLYADTRETYRQHAHDTITAALGATR